MEMITLHYLLVKINMKRGKSCSCILHLLSPFTNTLFICLFFSQTSGSVSSNGTGSVFLAKSWKTNLACLGN